MSKLVTNAPHADITYRIIGAAKAVHEMLGPGHREEVYQRAMNAKMLQAPYTLSFSDEPTFPVYDTSSDALLYAYRPDFLVEDAVILELKAQAHPLTNDDLAQVFDYFAASHYEVALLINFGRPRLEFKRLFPPKNLKIKRQG